MQRLPWVHYLKAAMSITCDRIESQAKTITQPASISILSKGVFTLGPFQTVCELRRFPSFFVQCEQVKGTQTSQR